MSLCEELELEAKRFGIKVRDTHKGVELLAPDGKQFDDDLHALVNSQYDNEPMPNVIRRAIKDVREYGPQVKDCPADCSCQEALAKVEESKL